MSRLSMRLSHAQAQRDFSIQLCVREKEIAVAIEPVHDGLIRFVSGFVAEADEI